MWCVVLYSLIETENIATLIRYVSEEPSEDMEEKVRFKYPHIACEILTAEVFSITEKLCDNEVSILLFIHFKEVKSNYFAIYCLHISGIFPTGIMSQFQLTFHWLLGFDKHATIAPNLAIAPYYHVK